ncbi:MAG: histidine kinase [Thiotrichaceae bacterium]|nr:histidine kinase [Thiotrichaceae bacterium]
MNNSFKLNFLPKLCVARSLFNILAITAVLSFVLTLMTSTDSVKGFFIQLGLTSLFVVWTAIMSVVIVCLLTRFLLRLSILNASLVIISIVIGFTLLASVLGQVASYIYINKEIEWDVLFILRNAFIGALIAGVILRYLFVHGQWEQHIQNDSAAKFTALQSRMRPHFLFNSLNTIVQLMSTDVEQAEEALLDLADIFRSTLDKRDRVSLHEELDVTTRYLRIEGLRLGKRRLSVVWDMDRNSLPFDMPIPPLLLQPLVENAIYHGIQPRKDGGTLGISLYDAGDYLEISVSNPIPPDGTSTHSKGNHIAQENLKNRLKIAYGDKAKLSITKSGHQYRVAFRIPKESV